MPRTLALTGGTGFIGSALIRRLTSSGWHIRALLRPASASKRPAGIPAEWIEGDLENHQSLLRLVRGVDAVVHCAGTVRGATRAQFNHVNVNGVAQLVQAATEQHPAPRFLLMSSLAAREPQLSPYADSKRLAEGVLAAESAKMPWTVFRPCAVYGPGDRELQPVWRWMAKGIAPLPGSDQGRFSLIYVEDLVEAIVGWLNCNNGQGRTFELHDGKPGGYSWHDVIATVGHLRRGRLPVCIRIPLILAKLIAMLNLATARAVGYAPMLTPGKIRELQHSDWICHNAALSASTGWTPRILLAEGLRRTLQWNTGA
jgi:nucleoside-diphosphate-sugar epimerase